MRIKNNINDIPTIPHIGTGHLAVISVAIAGSVADNTVHSGGK